LDIPSINSDQAPRLSERPRFVVLKNLANRAYLFVDPTPSTRPTALFSTPSIIRERGLSVSTVSSSIDHT